ncbi:hypothetical protein LWI28_017845 [Acer negundo]|uniref:Uncharacterized protein n=1 Tax=Acer negundo TaxID=4023 RepID=A0AAD5JPB8_ACENE|nr:hypothetical protein LWI28_017845 [Acer negundo]
MLNLKAMEKEEVYLGSHGIKHVMSSRSLLFGLSMPRCSFHSRSWSGGPLCLAIEQGADEAKYLAQDLMNQLNMSLGFTKRFKKSYAYDLFKSLKMGRMWHISFIRPRIIPMRSLCADQGVVAWWCLSADQVVDGEVVASLYMDMDFRGKVIASLCVVYFAFQCLILRGVLSWWHLCVNQDFGNEVAASPCEVVASPYV